MDNIKEYSVKRIHLKTLSFIMSNFPSSLTFLFTNLIRITLSFTSILISKFGVAMENKGTLLSFSPFKLLSNETTLYDFVYRLGVLFKESLKVTTFPISDGSQLSFLSSLYSRQTTDMIHHFNVNFSPILAVFNFLGDFDPLTLGDLDGETLGEMDYTPVV